SEVQEIGVRPVRPQFCYPISLLYFIKRIWPAWMAELFRLFFSISSLMEVRKRVAIAERLSPFRTLYFPAVEGLAFATTSTGVRALDALDEGVSRASSPKYC